MSRTSIDSTGCQSPSVTCVVCAAALPTGTLAMLCPPCERARAAYMQAHYHTAGMAIRWAAQRARRYERAAWRRRKETWTQQVQALETQVAMLRSQLMDQTKRDEIWQADFRKERKRIDAVIASLKGGDQ